MAAAPKLGQHRAPPGPAAHVETEAEAHDEGPPGGGDGPSKAEVVALLRSGYKPREARAEVERTASQLQAHAQAETHALEAWGKRERQQLAATAKREQAAVAAALAAEKRTIAASFATQRAAIERDVARSKSQVQAHGTADVAHIKQQTARQLQTLNASIGQKRQQLSAQTDAMAKEVQSIGDADAARIRNGISSAASEARAIGEREASKYGGDDKGRDQASAARTVANDTANDIEKKAPSAASELQTGKQPVIAKHREFGHSVDSQIGDTAKAMTAAIKSESDAAVKQVQAATKTAAQALDQLKQHQLAALRTAEQHGLAAADAAGAAARASVAAASGAATADLTKGLGVARRHIQAFSKTFAKQLRRARFPFLPGVRRAARTAEGDLQRSGAQIRTQLGTSAAAGIHAMTAAVGHARSAFAGIGGTAQKAASSIHAKVTSEAASTVQSAQAHSRQIVSHVQTEEHTLAANGLRQIDTAIQKARTDSTHANDQIRKESQKAADQTIEKAREPLGALPGRCAAAAAKAGEQHEGGLLGKIVRGVLGAIMGFLKGLVIVIALAVVLVAIVALTPFELGFMAALLIVGGTLLAVGAVRDFQARSSNPATRDLPLWKRVGLTAMDVTGVTGVYESASGKEIVTGRELTAEERAERGTTGVLTIVTLVLGARGAIRGLRAEPVEIPPETMTDAQAGAEAGKPPASPVEPGAGDTGPVRPPHGPEEGGPGPEGPTGGTPEGPGGAEPTRPGGTEPERPGGGSEGPGPAPEALDVQAQEQLGGHALERHGPDLDLDLMRQRVEGTAPDLPQSRTALKFVDEPTMTESINSAYARFRAEIVAHFKAGGGYKEWTLDTGKPVGEGFTNTGTRSNPVVQALKPAQVTKVTISFNTNPNAPGGFFLVSAFPAWP